MQTVFLTNVFFSFLYFLTLTFSTTECAWPCHSFKLAWLFFCNNVIFSIWIVSQIFSHLDCITNILPFWLYHKYFLIWIASQIFSCLDCITNILPFWLYHKYFTKWIVSQISSCLDCFTHIFPFWLYHNKAHLASEFQFQFSFSTV